MVYRLPASRRKLHLLRSLTSYKSPGRQSSIFWDTVLFIHKLKVQLEAIEREYSKLLAMKREYLNLVKQFHIPKEVRVERVGEELMVKVRCEKGEDRLVSILEAFEKMRLTVLQARVSCTNSFSMEAIAIAEDDDGSLLNVSDVTQAILVAIHSKFAANEQQKISEENAEIQ